MRIPRSCVGVFRRETSSLLKWSTSQTARGWRCGAVPVVASADAGPVVAMASIRRQMNGPLARRVWCTRETRRGARSKKPGSATPRRDLPGQTRHQLPAASHASNLIRRCTLGDRHVRGPSRRGRAPALSEVALGQGGGGEMGAAGWCTSHDGGDGLTVSSAVPRPGHPAPRPPSSSARRSRHHQAAIGGDRPGARRRARPFDAGELGCERGDLDRTIQRRAGATSVGEGRISSTTLRSIRRSANRKSPTELYALAQRASA